MNASARRTARPLPYVVLVFFFLCALQCEGDLADVVSALCSDLSGVTGASLTAAESLLVQHLPWLPLRRDATGRLAGIHA